MPPAPSAPAGLYFNPRFPRGKRRIIIPPLLQWFRFQSTLPAREATDDDVTFRSVGSISIHASREGSDGPGAVSFQSSCNFNPRFPRGKRRELVHERSQQIPISIHASREGSDQRIVNSFPYTFAISIHASREGSDLDVCTAISPTLTISIHASREGSDYSRLACNVPFRQFQSTLPAREATG